MLDIHSIIASSPRILLLLWSVTLPFCVFSGWLFFYVENQAAPVPAGLLAGLLLLIAGTLLLGTVETTLHYLRYDALRLTLTGEAPVVGKRLDGIVDLPASAAGAWMGAELACVHIQERSGRTTPAAFSEMDCWSDRRQFPVRRSGRRRSAVVRFEIPDSLPPSGAPGRADSPDRRVAGRDRYLWELRIKTGGSDREIARTLDVHVLPSASGPRREPSDEAA